MAGFKHFNLLVPPTGENWKEWANALRRFLMLKLDQIDRENDLEFDGTGSPEGVVAAKVGATYQRLDGGAGTTLYVKESGDGTKTGWVAK